MPWIPRHWFKVLLNFEKPCPETINATASARPTTVRLEASTIDDPWKLTLRNWQPLQANVMLIAPPSPTVSTLEETNKPGKSYILLYVTGCGNYERLLPAL